MSDLAKVGDPVSCPVCGTTSIANGSPDTFVDGQPVALVDFSYTACPCASLIVSGKSWFNVNGYHAAVHGSKTANGGTVLASSTLKTGTPSGAASAQATSTRQAPSHAPREQLQPAQPRHPQQPAPNGGTTFMAEPVVESQPQEPGFYIVPKSTTREALEATLFSSRNPAVMSKFQALNPNTGDVKAGSMIVLSDPNNFQCTREEALLMDAAAKTNDALKPLSADEADFMARHQAEIALMTGGASESLGVSKDMFEKGLKQVEGTLRNFERLHQQQFATHGHLDSPEFFASRRELYAQLDAQLRGAHLNKQLGLGSYDNLRRDLGISTRSTVHHWGKAGAPGQIPGYATHMDEIAKAAKYLKHGGYIGIALGGVSSTLKVQEVCRAGETEACQKIRFTETGSFAGGLGGGAAGVIGMSPVAGSICGAIGFSTGGIGMIICGLVVVGAGSYGGSKGGEWGGEKFGEKIYEWSH